MHIVFWSFRIMVGLGLSVLLGLGVWSLVAALSRTPLSSSPLAGAVCRCCSAPTGYIAVLSGWVTTEVGRQPYTVYGLLRTAESASPVRRARRRYIAGWSIVVVYLFIFGLGTFYTVRLLGRTPADSPPPQSRGLLDQGGRRAVRIWQALRGGQSS